MILSFEAIKNPSHVHTGVWSKKCKAETGSNQESLQWEAIGRAGIPVSQMTLPRGDFIKLPALSTFKKLSWKNRPNNDSQYYIYIPTYTIVDCSIIATSRQKKKDDKVHAKTVTATLIKMNQDLRGGLETCNCRWYAALDRNVPHIIPWSDKNSQLLIINKAPCGAVCLGFQKKKSKMQKWRFWWLTRLQTFVSGS